MKIKERWLTSITIICILTGCNSENAIKKINSETSSPILTHVITLTPTITSTFTESPTSTLIPTPTSLGGSKGIVFTLYPRTYVGKNNIRGGSNIFFANYDGSNIHAITTDGLLGFTEVNGVSPDGKKILIKSSSDIYMRNNSHLYLANIDGSEINRLDKNVLQIYGSEWLPNGKIAYIGDNNIYLSNSNGSDIIKGKWQPEPGHFVFMLNGFSKDRFYFTDAKGSKGGSETPTDQFWMMSDESGVIEKLSEINTHNKPWSYIISPDGTTAVWFDESGMYGTGKIYLAPIRYSGLSMLIEENNRRLIVDSTLGSGFFINANINWSSDGSIIWIESQFDMSEHGSMKPLKFIYSYWDVKLSKLIEIPVLEMDNFSGDFGGLYTIISPDGKQVIYTDNGTYIGIINLSTMEISRKFGCTISNLCPDQPSHKQPNNWNDYENHLVANSIYWLP
jgi:hypothetical protein